MRDRQSDGSALSPAQWLRRLLFRRALLWLIRIELPVQLRAAGNASYHPVTYPVLSLTQAARAPRSDTWLALRTSGSFGTRAGLASGGVAADENGMSGLQSLHDMLSPAGDDSSAGDGKVPPPEVVVPEEHVRTWELVQRAQSGDGQAFGQLYDLYVDLVYRFIYFRVHDRQLAEDFTSETFLRALRRITTISYQGRDIGAWFMTIARNIVLDHAKSARVKLEYSTADIAEDSRSTPSPETAVLAQLSNQRLMLAVQQLGDEQRECVILRFIQGLSVAETAEIMGKKEGAIKALQHRAIRKLSDAIAEELGDAG